MVTKFYKKTSFIWKNKKISNKQINQCGFAGIIASL